MNRECNGDFFTVNETDYYRCLYEGEIFKRPDSKTCPRCNRVIDATEHGVLPHRKKILIEFDIPNFCTEQIIMDDQ